MNKSRYTILKDIECNKNSLDCPVGIQRAVLLKDIVANKILLQLKMINLSEYTIKSIYLSLVPYTDGNDVLGEPGGFKYSYVDKYLKPEAILGVKDPVVFPDANTRNVAFFISKIVFENGEIREYEKNDIKPFQQTKLEEHLSEELLNELKSLINTSSVGYLKYKPVVEGDVWGCMCGQINKGTRCSRCTMTKTDVIEKSSPEFLMNSKRIRAEKELADKLLEIEEAKRHEELLNNRKIIDAYWFCDQCKTPNNNENNFCKQCGSTHKKENISWECPKCHQDNGKINKLCTGCGYVHKSMSETEKIEILKTHGIIK